MAPYRSFIEEKLREILGGPMSKPSICQGCPLYKTGEGPVYPSHPQAQDEIPIVVIGEAPGATEVEQQAPFVGSSGRKLRHMLRVAGISPNNCLIANTVWCRPPGNQTPDEATISYCTQRHLMPLLERYATVDWILVGSIASQAIAGEQITRCQGYIIKNPRGTNYFYPVLHPQAVLRSPSAEYPTLRFLTRAANHERPITTPKFTINPDPYSLVEFVARCRANNLVVFDVETGQWLKEPLSIAITSGAGETVAVKWSPMVANILRPLFEDSIAKAGYNIRFDIRALRRAGIHVYGDWVDVMRLVQMDSYSNKLSLEAVAPIYLPLEPWKQHGIQQGMLVYNARDAFYTWAILSAIVSRINGTPRHRLFQRTKNLEKALDIMETRGFLIDRMQITTIKESLGDASNSEINANSPKQVSESLKSKGIKFWKTNLGQESTGQTYLRRMAARENPEHAAHIKNVLGQRYLSILHKRLANLAESLNEDGILRPSIRIIGRVDGRLTTSEPNLSIIFGDPDLKKLLIARPGYQILAAEWPQAEIRIAAILSGEQQLVEAKDVHQDAAKQLFQTATPTKEQREIAKRILYGFVHGAGPIKISEVAGVPTSAVKNHILALAKVYHHLFQWLDAQVEFAEQNGYLVNPFGRATNFQSTRGLSWARGFVVRTSLTDMFNIILCEIYDLLMEERSSLLLQVFDQVLVEVDMENEPHLIEQIKKIIKGPWPELNNTRMLSRFYTGATWNDQG